jgi:hypothetical protein
MDWIKADFGDTMSQFSQAPANIPVRFTGTDICDFVSQVRKKDMSFWPCPFMDLLSSGLGFRIAVNRRVKRFEIQELL